MDLMQLRKYQAVGNDFLLLLDLEEQQPIDEARARALCDRRRGVGADGLIRLTPGKDGADITFELRNSDGSPAETSGNGLRCVTRALLDAGLVAGPRVVIETVVGQRVATVGDDGVIGVEMGSARIEDVPDGPSSRSSLVDLGNPHLVILDEGQFDLPSLGAKYPQYNVELITVADGEIAMQVWERGAGETLACGTGSCASAAAAHAWGLVSDHVVVHNPGGDVEVTLGDPIVLSGPATYVATVDVP
jgi:diaminopimelate epimerase